MKRSPVSRRARILKVLGFALLFIIGGTVAAGAIVYTDISRDLPDLDGRPAGRDQTSVITDRNGKTLATLFAEENRTDRPLSEIPHTLRQAVIATEDKRFYEHSGLDPIGIARALWIDITTDRRRQGGSTITQQYIKNAFLTPERTLRRKIAEAILAHQLESRYGKDRILELYLNTIYFGHGAYGVESAAQTYFGKSVDELDLAESATLAGVIRSPGRYSPYLDPEASIARRNTVLRLMADQSLISEEERAAAAASEPDLAGLADRNIIAPYFVEYIKAQLIDMYGSELVFRGGIRVTTTLDLTLQRAAESAVAEHLNEPDDPSAALVALDPASGEILAMVGGTDFSEKQFNVAVQGRRQPGSVFKPFVLAAALKDGATPEQTFERAPAELSLPNGDVWSVTGANGPPGPMRLREAMEKSINSVFARLVLDVGPEAVAETARRMGVTSDITPVPALALGGHAEGVSPLEMAAAYGTLAANGRHAVPFSIMRVESADGESIFAGAPSVSEVLDPAIAYMTTDVLRGVITEGTGRSASIGRPAAGKTGTTQEYRDAWFVGYTPDLVTAVWVGHPEAARSMNDVRGRPVTGGSIPARIWSAFMKQALDERTPADFSKPDGISTITVCSESGGLASEWCESTRRSVFLSTNPPEPCPTHTGPEMVELPNLVGLAKEQAVARLAALGLTAAITEEHLRGIPLGLVARHTPSAQTEVEAGSSVALVVSKGEPPNPRPIPSFSHTPPVPGFATPVSFDASGSSDDTEIALYVWEFGDGNRGEGRTVTHTYARPGTYEVTLWVTDAHDQTSALTKSIVIR